MATITRLGLVGCNELDKSPSDDSLFLLINRRQEYRVGHIGQFAIAYDAAGDMQTAKEMWQFIKESNATPDQRDEMQRLLTAYHESS